MMKAVVNACFSIDALPQGSQAILPVLGVPMIERCLREARRAGLKEVVLISAEDDNEVRLHAESLSQQLKFKVEHVLAKLEGNEVDAFLQAQSKAGKTFALLSANRLFDANNVKRLISKRSHVGTVTMLTDAHPLQRQGD
jgi:NDP-sugar pyrophosphorylase family protein